jgi:thioredoxin reductase (NADPH)
MSAGEVLDCLVVGGGPAGMTAALYLARFGRRFALIDAGDPRAAWIPRSHNLPFFEHGIGGPAILARLRANLAQYDVHPQQGQVDDIACEKGVFVATVNGTHGALAARRVILATGAHDVEPDLPDLTHAVRRGLIRYCPICDGYEARGKRIGVIGHGDQGLAEAVFVARTYSKDVTLLTLGQGMALTDQERDTLDRHGITAVETPIESLHADDSRIHALCSQGGKEWRFEVLYSALGLHVRSELAQRLGAETDERGAVRTRDHARTSVPGVYAAGDTVRGLAQIVVGMGHAAAAATDVHNRCELPTEDEVGDR